ncbi:hypothetical protein MMC17_000123 [Xylographa soralifera]|nr:hypothetical protein [Xylographa soralifera]
MTGYIKQGNTNSKDDLQIRVARHSQSKQTYPGILDDTTGGGISTGDSLFESPRHKAVKEASIPIEYARHHARVCGRVTYFDIQDERVGGDTGLLQPEYIYVYDLEMQEDMELSPGDREAQKFALWSVGEVER